MWNCPKGPNGENRKKVPYFSNPNVCYEGVHTGDAYNNNAAFITENRFKFRDVGSNCLDGVPNEEWNFGKICINGETSYTPAINKSEGIFTLYTNTLYILSSTFINFK